MKNGFWSDKNVNPKFVEALSPDFNVISGYYNVCNETVNPPVTINPTKRQTVYKGQVMKFLIPRDTFHDKEDGYTHQLSLGMTKMNGENLLPTSWILLFDSPQQEILSLPIGNNKLGMHRFRLTATDKDGFTASDDFEVKVLEDTNTYNHEFTIDAAVEDSLKSRVIFVETLANYFGVDFRDVRVRSYGSDVKTVFQFAIRNLTCDDLQLLKSSFIMNKKLNENFINALRPKFVVSSGSYKGLNICPPLKPTPKNNTPPQLYNHIDRLDVFQGQGLRFHIPYDTFYDQEDLYTPNLKREMRTIDRDKLLRTSWILFNSSRQEIYGLPSDVNRIGIHEFLIVAADKKGSKAYDAFEVSVLEDNIPYSHKFNILIDYDNVTFMENVGIRMLVLDKIASYFGVNFTTVRVISYTPGVVFTFYFDFLPYEECSHPNLEKLIDGFWFGDNLNSQFIAALAPDFRVISGSYEMLSPCKVIPPVAGLVADSDTTGAAAAGEAIGEALAEDVLARLSAVWSAIAGGGGLSSQKIADVREAIDEDVHALTELRSSLCLLEDRVADFAVFCRDHIDLVLSSELVDGEFRFLLYVLRGAHSPGAAANTQVPLSTLLDEKMNIIVTRVSTLLEQLGRSTANQEVSSVTQQILDELPEGPNDEEVPTMIMNFMEAKFTEACKS